MASSISASVVIPLTQNLSVEVDVQDVLLVSKHKWHAVKCHGKWYAATTWFDASHRRHRLYMHRLIAGSSRTESQFFVDHRDGNGLNNRRENLRWSTPTQNNLNSSAPRDAIDMRGIYEQSGRFIVKLSYRRKPHYGGCFGTLDEARACRKELIERVYASEDLEFARMQ
jgi:hypothetical protein